MSAIEIQIRLIRERLDRTAQFLFQPALHARIHRHALAADRIVRQMAALSAQQLVSDGPILPPIYIAKLRLPVLRFADDITPLISSVLAFVNVLAMPGHNPSSFQTLSCTDRLVGGLSLWGIHSSFFSSLLMKR